jgi:hypothetical protein
MFQCQTSVPNEKSKAHAVCVFNEIFKCKESPIGVRRPKPIFHFCTIHFVATKQSYSAQEAARTPLFTLFKVTQSRSYLQFQSALRGLSVITRAAKVDLLEWKIISGALTSLNPQESRATPATKGSLDNASLP